MKSVIQRGRFFRVCDPTWSNCCDGNYAKRYGGRWNPPESFDVLYLNVDIETARANAALNYEGEAFGLFDLNPTQRPHLQSVVVATCEAVDAIDADARVALGLPPYDTPFTGYDVCCAIGVTAHASGHAGVACTSAALQAGTELALFDLHLMTPGERQTFDAWFFG